MTQWLTLLRRVPEKVGVDECTPPELVDLSRPVIVEEIIELVCASSLLSWAGTLNTTVRLETAAHSIYGRQLAYARA